MQNTCLLFSIHVVRIFYFNTWVLGKIWVKSCYRWTKEFSETWPPAAQWVGVCVGGGDAGGYLSFPVLWQTAGLELLRQHGEQLQQRQAARPSVHPSPLLLEHAHHLGHGARPGLGHGVEGQRGQRHAQPGEHHLGAGGEAGDLGEQLRLQGLVLVGGDVGPVAGDLGVECVGAEVLDLWDLWASARQKWTWAFFSQVCARQRLSTCVHRTLSGLSKAQQNCQAWGETWACISHFWARFLFSILGS